MKGDDPARDQRGRGFPQLVDVLLRDVIKLAAHDIGEQQQSRHGVGRLAICIEELPPDCRTQGQSRRKALNPDLPDDVAIARIDWEQRTVALGSIHQCQHDIVVVKHDQTEQPVGMVKVFEGTLFGLTLAVPDQRKPFIGRDHLRTHQQARNEAIEFFDEHCVIAQGMQLLLKLLTAM